MARKRWHDRLFLTVEITDQNRAALRPFQVLSGVLGFAVLGLIALDLTTDIAINNSIASVLGFVLLLLNSYWLPRLAKNAPDN